MGRADTARETPEDGDELDAETEAAVRRAVRAELHAQTRAAAQVIAGILFALFVLPAVSALVYPPLFEAGMPPAVLGVGSIALALLLVAYGWRLPPFR